MLVNRNPNLKNVVNYILDRKGTYQAVVKCQAGYLIITDCRTNYEGFKPSHILSQFKKGALQAITFTPEGSNHHFTVFSRAGKSIKVIDTQILEGVDVGTINQLWYNTDLYNQTQYQAVNASNWASKAYSMNEQVTA